jgi:endo-1,4-beta-xylanase
VVRACLNNNRCPGITVCECGSRVYLASRRLTSSAVTGSFVDSVSWIPEVFPGEGAADLYDLNFQPKPAYYAVQQALE